MRKAKPKTSSRRPRRVASSGQIAEQFDVDRRTIRRWTERGCPYTKGRPGSPHRFDPLEVAQWLKTEGLTGSVGRPSDEEGASPDTRDALAAAKLESEQLRARKLRLHCEQVEGNLVARVEVEEGLVARARLFRVSLLGLAARLAPVIAPLDSVAAVERRLRSEFEGVLREYAREES